MRRIVLAALVAAATLSSTACDRAEQPRFLEPVLAVSAEPPNPCPDVIGIAALDSITSKYELVQALYLGIDALFLDARSKNGAKSHVDNIVREICTGDYEGAADFVHNFIQQVDGQPDRMLSPEVPHPEDLIAWVQVLATDLAVLDIVLPEGVVAFTGALSITSGGESAAPVKTRNGHVLVNASDFPPGGSFIVAIAPGPASYAPYPLYEDESYQIVTNGSPDAGGALVAFCGIYPASLRIAHVKDEGIEVLDREDPGALCDPAPTALLLDAVPGWLRPLGTLALQATRGLIFPTPLYARTETGLGGRAKSFSGFGVVDPVATLAVSCVSRLEGFMVSVRSGDEVLCTAGKGAVTEVVSLPVGAQTLTAEAVGYGKLHDIWFSSGSLTLDPALCPAKWQSGGTAPAQCTFTLPAGGGSIDIKLTSS